MSTYYDHRLRFQATETGVTRALAALAAVRASGKWYGSAPAPRDMLGDYIPGTGTPDADGVLQYAIRGGRGRAATSYTDPDGNTVQVPAAGDPAYWYVCITSHVNPAIIPLPLLASYGLEPVDEATIVAVLGVAA